MSNVPRLRPSLSDALSVVLPTSEQTLLLHACLHSGESARQAWEEWQQRRSEFASGFLGDHESIKKLRPLVFNALRRHGIEIDKESQTYLRSAYLKEELRSKTFRRICRDVLLLLASERIPAIVLKGTALAETVYDNPVLRHCHDIDLLLGDGDLNRAAELLRALGFQPAIPEADQGSKDCRLEHESGLPLELHSRLFALDYYNAPLADMWQRSEGCAIANVQGRILSPVDGLLHICGHAFYSARFKSLRWVCDAWFIIHRRRDLDWELFLDCARQSRLTLALSITLGYLAEHLKAPIPARFLNRLFAAAANTNRIERELALFAALTASQDRPVNFLRKTKGWRARALLIQWMLFPSPTYLSMVEKVRRFWLLPLHYVYRPLRYARYRLSSQCAGLIQRVRWRIERLCLRINLRTP